MPLFRVLSDQKLQKIDRKEFNKEEELHQLMDNNLSYIMGIRFIARKYPIPNGEIDTLGLDEDGVPVIIEYKWKKDLSAIVQGMFYLDWVMKNKKPFESIVKDKLGNDVNVNWSTQPRLLIIAQDFDVKELSAINQMGPRVDLKKYSLYEGLFSIEDVNIVGKKQITPPTEEGAQAEKYTIEQILKKADPERRELFLTIRDRILGISDAVWERVGNGYCDYRTSSTFTTVLVHKQKLRVFIKMGDRKIEDPQNKSKSIPPSFGYGRMNRQFEIRKREEIDYSMKLIMQAYNYVSE